MRKALAVMLIAGVMLPSVALAETIYIYHGEHCIKGRRDFNGDTHSSGILPKKFCDDEKKANQLAAAKVLVAMLGVGMILRLRANGHRGLFGIVGGALTNKDETGFKLELVDRETHTVKPLLQWQYKF